MRYEVITGSVECAYTYYVLDTETMCIVPMTGTNSRNKALEIRNSYNDIESDRKYYEHAWKERIIGIHKENARGKIQD